MNSFEALGRYHYHKELAENFALAMKIAMDGLKMTTERIGESVVNIDPDGTVKLLGMANNAKTYLLKHTRLANEAAVICGAAPVSLESLS